MTDSTTMPADQPSPFFLWEALLLPAEARQLALDHTDRILQELDTVKSFESSGDVERAFITRQQIASLLLPLALAAQELAHTSRQRVLVGLTGGAGTGKSMLSVLLCRVLRTLAGQEIAVPLGVDAYHFPNDFLDRQLVSYLGRDVPLRHIKGLPPTFDVEALVADLQRLRCSQEHEIRLPVYDRAGHDPVPDALCVQPHHRIVIVEGLHLLRLEDDWRNARECLELCVLLELPLETCRRRVVARKIAGGRSPEDVLAHFERVDRPTLEALRDPKLRERADLVIQLEESDEDSPVRSTGLRGCERPENLTESIQLRPIPPGTVRLLAVGLNPALQKTLVFDSWQRGQVNRACEILTSVGGKGQQFSRAASRHLPGMVTLAQFLGGENGEHLRRMLQQAGIDQITTASTGETRCCLTLIDASAGDATELIEPSAPIAPGEIERLLTGILHRLARGDVSGLAICGTYPPGVTEEFYVALARSKGQAILLLDGYQQITETLATDQVDILKVNVHELQSLATRIGRCRRPDDAGHAASVPELAMTVLATHHLRWLAVTAGPHTAWLFERPCGGSATSDPCSWRYFEYRLPTVDGVRNPIGAGDTVGATFLAQLCAGTSAHAAFACGLAAGSASCRQLGGADFTMDDLHDILPKIQIVRWNRWWTNSGSDKPDSLTA